MRKYICIDCGTSWQVIFGEEIPGIKQACPKCKSLNVNSMSDKHKWDQDDRGIPLRKHGTLQDKKDGDLVAGESTTLINEEI